MGATFDILVVDDEGNVRRVLGTLLEQAGHTTSRAASGEQALELVRDHDPDLVITDLRMDGMDGMELLDRLRRGFPVIPVVMLTAHGTVDNAVEAMKRGAADFITKPFDRDEVLALVAKVLAQANHGRREFRGPLVDGEQCGIVGGGPAMLKLKRTIEKIASAPSPVLIRGETGTGKELVAEALHQLSARSGEPLVKINCGALPENLVESELFGHVRGAFTGAERARPGRFELADRGSLFLDEVGELPAAIQVKLLRVLQDGVVDPIGSARPLRVDVRLIAATHRDLKVEAAEGRFREDLLYRLNVVELHVPPLRERREDIPALVELFLDRHTRRLRRAMPRLSPEAGAELCAQPWPGNVRELENAVERAVLLGEETTLGAQDFGLPEAARARPTGSTIKEAARAAASEIERRMIVEALETDNGNVTRAAARLGLSRRGLQIKMREFGLRT